MKESISMKNKMVVLVRVAVCTALAGIFAGCVPGETVVAISADDIDCVMTGGVRQVEIVSTLTNTIPMIDLSKVSKTGLEHWNISSTNIPLEAVQKVFKCIEESVAAFLAPEEKIKLCAKEEGTNIFVSAHIKRKAVFIADPKNLSVDRARDLCLYIGKKDGLTFAENPAEKQLEVVAGLLCGYIHMAFNSKELADCAIGIYWILSSPFEAKSNKIRIVGDGADKFKVEGLRIVRLHK